MQKEAALYEIEGIEKTFHKAATTHNVNLMMSLFAPGAVFNIGTETYTGRPDQEVLRHEEHGLHAPEPLAGRHPLVPDQGDRERRQGNALLRVRLHRHQDGQGDGGGRRRPQVQKINGKWLIIDSAAAPTSLSIQG